MGLAHRLQFLLAKWGLAVEQEGVNREIELEGVFSVLVGQMGETPVQVLVLLPTFLSVIISYI